MTLVAQKPRRAELAVGERGNWPGIYKGERFAKLLLLWVWPLAVLLSLSLNESASPQNVHRVDGVCVCYEAGRGLAYRYCTKGNGSVATDVSESGVWQHPLIAQAFSKRYPFRGFSTCSPLRQTCYFLKMVDHLLVGGWSKTKGNNSRRLSGRAAKKQRGAEGAA